MNRPLHIWSVFIVCALVLLGAVTWVTGLAFRLERAQAEAQRAAEFEEKVRLALWRMDSLLTPIIVEESARPAAHYRALTPTGNTIGSIKYAAAAYVPSPLWFQVPAHARVYFELAPDGTLTSPSLWPKFDEPLFVSELLRSYPTTQNVASVATRLDEFDRLLSAPAAEPGSLASFNNGMLLSNVAVASATNASAPNFTNTLLAANQQAGQAPIQQAFNVNPAQIKEQNYQAQELRNSAEFQARANVYQQAAQAGINAYAQQVAPVRPARSGVMSAVKSEGPMTPVWLGSALVLVRRAEGATIQGVWLNWDGLKQTLQENVRDLFPAADWRAATGTNAYGGRRLAALPVEFVPGAITSRSLGIWTSARLTVALAWGGMLLALAAVGVLLHGAVSLSERRGAFVSAVTHEMRTPLTTFKMYSEMLADGMVSDETKQKQYLATLCSEANRLSHLVENVLAYARLERGSARRRVERVTLGDLIERLLPRLQERAERAEIKVVVDADDVALATVVHVDAAAVEQILFNLVDNACKYAAPTATEKLIHLEAWPDGKFAMLRVRDHGQGISSEGAKRLFKPFSKSAQEAAHSAPGIGLGLALCRRLSRSIGGDLRLDRTSTRGACFELRLPLATDNEAAALSSI